MLFFFLTMSLSTITLVLNETSFGTIREKLTEETGPLVIESTEPYLCLIFRKINRTRINVFSNGDLFQTGIEEGGHIAGIDFGNNLGKVIIQPRFKKCAVKITYLVFPKTCADHRIISTLPYDIVDFSSRSDNTDFLITNDQVFCFWPAQIKGHYLTITVNSEDNFDLLTLRTPIGITNCYTGQQSDYIYSPKGLDLFVWQTDHACLSDSFSIKSTNVEEPLAPIFRRILKGVEASEVQYLYEFPRGGAGFVPPPEIEAARRKKQMEMSHLINVFMGLTATMVVLMLAVLSWCVVVAARVKKEEQDEITDEDTRMDDSYIEANDGTMLPQPMSL